MNSLLSYFEPYISSMTSEFPTKKSEEYRYSNVINKLAEIQVQPNIGKKLDLPIKGDYDFFADQVLENCITKSFDQLPKNFHRFHNYFKQASLAKNNKVYDIVCEKEEMTLNFTATTHSVLTDKIYIYIPSQKKAQINLHFYTDENSISMPMIYIDAQENTHVELIYTVNQANNKGIIAPIFELIAQKESHVSLQTFTQGVEYHRLTFIGFCDGSKSHIDLRTGFHLQEKETCDLFVRIHHEAEDSTSNQMIKTVVDDHSQMNFNGLIYANNEAHNIYAYQMLKGMILNDNAQINARPQLDIEYFELACSHGVSIGGFDPEELFYLKSRGITEKDAYALLLYGFFCEPFIDINLENFWTDRIKQLIKTEQI